MNKKGLVAMAVSFPLVFQMTAIAAPSFNPFDSAPTATQNDSNQQPNNQSNRQAQPQQGYSQPRQGYQQPQQPSSPTPAVETTVQEDMKMAMQRTPLVKQLASINVSNCAGEANFAKAVMQAKYQNTLNLKDDSISDVLEFFSLKGSSPRLITSIVYAASTPAVSQSEAAGQIQKFANEREQACRNNKD